MKLNLKITKNKYRIFNKLLIFSHLKYNIKDKVNKNYQINYHSFSIKTKHSDIHYPSIRIVRRSTRLK